jgi:hypothetical protein
MAEPRSSSSREISPVYCPYLAGQLSHSYPRSAIWLAHPIFEEKEAEGLRYYSSAVLVAALFLLFIHNSRQYGPLGQNQDVICSRPTEIPASRIPRLGSAVGQTREALLALLFQSVTPAIVLLIVRADISFLPATAFLPASC